MLLQNRQSKTRHSCQYRYIFRRDSALDRAVSAYQSPMGCCGVMPCSQATLPRILRKAR
jgi:hypothetical protein